VTGLLKHKRVLGTLLVALFAGFLHTGCADRKAGKPKIRTREGIAEKIDLQNNSVSMRLTDGKAQGAILEGQVREDTIVKINGRDEKLEHVRPGDKVKVSGYKEGEGNEAKLVATMVEVIRPEGADWKSTSKPSEKPVETKPAPAPAKPAGPTTAPAAAGTTNTKKPG
jgi:hypothetical protein